MVLGTVFVEAMLTLAVLAFLPAYLHERFGLSLFQAGLIAALFGSWRSGLYPVRWALGGALG